MSSFVVDHTQNFRVIVGNQAWIVIGWYTADAERVQPVVVHDGRPVVVNENRGAWAKYELRRERFQS